MIDGAYQPLLDLVAGLPDALRFPPKLRTAPAPVYAGVCSLTAAVAVEGLMFCLHLDSAFTFGAMLMGAVVFAHALLGPLRSLLRGGTRNPSRVVMRAIRLAWIGIMLLVLIRNRCGVDAGVAEMLDLLSSLLWFSAWYFVACEAAPPPRALRRVSLGATPAMT
ncbi:MAG TPA: hypothetical protein VKI44_13925 [Acetobacteraceae bacterium]|nr:hypothetical protein [Acetobacteraceae bacterium]